MQSMHALQKQATAMQMHLCLIIRDSIAQTLDDVHIRVTAASHPKADGDSLMNNAHNEACGT